MSDARDGRKSPTNGIFLLKDGALRFNITGHLKGAAKLTAEGIDGAEASLPKGSHKFHIAIQDTARRVGARMVQFSEERLAIDLAPGSVAPTVGGEASHALTLAAVG